jgi:hypothetical protein
MKNRKNFKLLLLGNRVIKKKPETISSKTRIMGTVHSNRILLKARTHLTLSLIFTILIYNMGLIPSTLEELSNNDYAVTLLPEEMPLGLSHGSGAWDGKYAYVFGGWDGPHASGVIVKYDPINHLATALFDNLPSPRWGTSAVYADGTIWGAHNVCYIFGGQSGIGAYDASVEVVRFWPEDGWRDIKEYIPGRMETSAIWDGKAAYLFGGKEAPGESIPSAFLDEILKFDTRTSKILPAKLPHARAHTSAVWDGENAYIFGGGYINETLEYELLDDILKFNPVTNKITIMEAKLPTPRAYTSAIWDGHNAYIFGGRTIINGSSTYLDEVLMYNPLVDEVSVTSQKLPTPREETVAVWTGSAAYIFGGRGKNAHVQISVQIVMMSRETVRPSTTFPWHTIILMLTLAGGAAVLFSIYAVKKRISKAKEKSH